MPELALDIASSWDRIADVSERALHFFRDAGSAPDHAAAMTMVTTELLENAVKYGPADGEVRLRLFVQKKEASVEVTNRVDASAGANLARLDDMVQWIRGYQDPFEAYSERLREVAGQRLDDSRSGLGLVRIAYEGRAVLDFIVDEKDCLTVSAVRRE